MSLEDANERQKRIAQLRAERRQNKQSKEVSDSKAKQNETEQRQHDKPELEEHKEHQTNGQTDDQPPPNIYHINSEETVELVARDIQDKVLQKAEEAARFASETFNIDDVDEETKIQPYNKDMKESMAREFQLADMRTNRAINKILQQKYNQA